MASDADRRELATKMTDFVRRTEGATDAAAWSRAFAKVDKNKDGLINADELKALLQQADVGNWATIGAWTSGVMEELDTNRDGISLSELVQALAGSLVPAQAGQTQAQPSAPSTLPAPVSTSAPAPVKIYYPPVTLTNTQVWFWLALGTGATTLWYLYKRQRGTQA